MGNKWSENRFTGESSTVLGDRQVDGSEEIVTLVGEKSSEDHKSRVFVGEIIVVSFGLSASNRDGKLGLK